MIAIGIDPGQLGGIAVIYPTADFGTQAIAIPMPKTERDIWLALRGYRDIGSCTAIIELVHAMPRQGVSSSFKFGCNYGFLRACLTAADIPFSEATPRTWMKGLGARTRKKAESKTQWKHYLRGLAQQRFPQLKVTLKTADALLIAWYAWREHNGQPTEGHQRDLASQPGR